MTLFYSLELRVVLNKVYLLSAGTGNLNPNLP